MKSPDRPIGHPTRGKTAPNRLRRVDLFVSKYFRDLITRSDGDFHSAFFVDLGFGAEPTTTLETANSLQKINPDLPVLGIDLDKERLMAAEPYQTEKTFFRIGGFNLPILPGEHVRMIRVFNVLRQYEPNHFFESISTMAESLLPGGVILEGTFDPFGRVWVTNLIQKTDRNMLDYLGLTFSTNLRWGFSPSLFPPVLPKNLIHKIVHGETIHEVITAWEKTATETISHKEFGLRQWFIESALALNARGFQIDTRKKYLKAGFLTWIRPSLSLGV